MSSVLDQLASVSGKREQDMNIALAQKIAAEKDKKALKELVAGLEHKTKAIRHDCIKALYETAALAPGLLSPHADTFVQLLSDKDNRMQWGAMTALSALVQEVPEQLYQALDQLIDVADKGSVITRDHMVRILAGLSTGKKYAATTLPLLMEQILQSPVNQVPSYAEQALPVITPEFKDRLVQVLQTRLQDIEQDSKRKRVEKVLKKLKG
jgi:hypothetical protein